MVNLYTLFIFQGKERKWKTKFATVESEWRIKYQIVQDEKGLLYDKASTWHEILKITLILMKFNNPDIHTKLVNQYGGEDKFQDWYKLPDIPMVPHEDKNHEAKEES
ncbi:MAG: hypothetical protein HS127_07305 [Planctomycetia bacterium]|uniref:hypothetical protein n=1 Tax=Candidatus Kuenenia sp. TaxID=2499824 RepID=UPI001D3A589A|nr:hypothetical protein [Planctomycetia bacterium]MCL4743610.1 hypothetical protein [Phycisphaerales bacterium]